MRRSEKGILTGAILAGAVAFSSAFGGSAKAEGQIVPPTPLSGQPTPTKTPNSLQASPMRTAVSVQPRPDATPSTTATKAATTAATKSATAPARTIAREAVRAQELIGNKTFSQLLIPQEGFITYPGKPALIVRQTFVDKDQQGNVRTIYTITESNKQTRIYKSIRQADNTYTKFEALSLPPFDRKNVLDGEGKMVAQGEKILVGKTSDSNMHLNFSTNNGKTFREINPFPEIDIICKPGNCKGYIIDMIPIPETNKVLIASGVRLLDSQIAPAPPTLKNRIGIFDMDTGIMTKTRGVDDTLGSRNINNLQILGISNNTIQAYAILQEKSGDKKGLYAFSIDATNADISQVQEITNLDLPANINDLRVQKDSNGIKVFAAGTGKTLLSVGGPGSSRYNSSKYDCKLIVNSQPVSCDFLDKLAQKLSKFDENNSRFHYISALSILPVGNRMVVAGYMYHDIGPYGIIDRAGIIASWEAGKDPNLEPLENIYSSVVSPYTITAIHKLQFGQFGGTSGLLFNIGYGLSDLNALGFLETASDGSPLSNATFIYPDKGMGEDSIATATPTTTASATSTSEPSATPSPRIEPSVTSLATATVVEVQNGGGSSGGSEPVRVEPIKPATAVPTARPIFTATAENTATATQVRVQETSTPPAPVVEQPTAQPEIPTQPELPMPVTAEEPVKSPEQPLSQKMDELTYQSGKFDPKTYDRIVTVLDYVYMQEKPQLTGKQLENIIWRIAAEAEALGADAIDDHIPAIIEAELQEAPPEELPSLVTADIS